MSNSVEKLINLHDAVIDSPYLTPVLLEMIANALYNWRYRGVPIGIALGITDSVEERRNRRNDALRKYALELPGKRWTKARWIAKEIGEIRQEHNYTNPAVNHILKNIDSIYRLPESQRQISNILKS